MHHKPLNLNNLSLTLPHKTCFMDFSCQIHNGDSIAVIGRNGSGKTSLLNMIRNEALEQNFIVGFVPQIIQNKDNLSGGEKFMQIFMEELSKDPDILLLDEPTNHLDSGNRLSLFHMLDDFAGSIIAVSHDIELNQKMNILWHIHNEKINLFKGSYDDYLALQEQQYRSLQNSISNLNQNKKDLHKSLMKEQSRASKSKARGQKSIDNRKWPTITSKCKINRAAAATGKKKSAISKSRQEIAGNLEELYMPKELTPKFHLKHSKYSGGNLITISNGTIFYEEQKPILQNINLVIENNQKILVKGNNGSGKTSLIKAILGNINRGGNWNVIDPKDIGYLSQSYDNISAKKTPYELIEQLRNDWDREQIRAHLNDFLFRKNEEVFSKISNLSGGEKARLSLCLIAANAPRLLILDEVTNNIDLETKHHILSILKAYHGTLIIISHDKAFVDELGIDKIIDVEGFNQST